MSRLAVRVVAAMAVAVASLVAPPASAAAPVAISDGFTASGPAGSQATVRVTKPIRLNAPLSDRPFSLTASSGPLAGFALQPADPRSGSSAFLVQSTREWSCGSGGCGRDARLAYGMTWALERVLPKGDYLLVLIGAPGARVTVTLSPAAKGARPVRVPLSRRTTPVVTETDDVATGTGTDPVATGRATPRDLPGRVLFGILHTMTFSLGREGEVDLTAGRRGWDTRCYGMFLGTRRSADDPGPEEGPVHRTQAIFDEQLPGSAAPCAEWTATVRAARTTHRAVVVQVPLAF